MARTLIATGTPGWFKDAADPDGRKVRKQDGDEILTIEQAAQVRAEAQAEPQPNGNRGTEAAKAAVRAAEPQVTVADTGKILTGKTITITCSERGCKNTRVIKTQDAFQVKRCVQHQEEHRKQLHREKQRRRAKARREAKAAAKAAAVA